MVVQQPQLRDATDGPSEYKPPAAVHANTMASGQIAFQRLEPVGRRHAQIIQGLSHGKHV